MTFLNFTLCTMSRRSASNLSNSLFCGGHFLDLKPKLLLVATPTISTEKNCNCRKKKDCPLKNNCLTSSVIYNANVTTESDAAGMNYIGLTEGTFKQPYTQHKLSFRNRNYSNSTELSKHIWTLKDSNTNYKIDWSILATAPAGLQQQTQTMPLMTS